MTTNELTKSVVLETELARKQYVDRVCSGCMRTQQQLERDCTALQGIGLGCVQMENAIRKKKAVKQSYNKFLKNEMKSLMDKCTKL